MIFFSKDSAWGSGSGNPIDSLHISGVALKKIIMSESIKKDTKVGKTWVWNELQPKLIHQHLTLNKRLLKK